MEGREMKIINHTDYSVWVASGYDLAANDIFYSQLFYSRFI